MRDLTMGRNIMNEKKRAKIIKVCKVVAMILAVLMVLGVIMQGLL